MRFVGVLWINVRPPERVRPVSNTHNPSRGRVCRHVLALELPQLSTYWSDHQGNYNCFNEPFAVSPYKSLYWDMHGLVFKTSIWLLAGSTRLQLLCTWYCWMTSIKVETARVALELFCVNVVHIWAACFKSVWKGCDNGIIPYSEMRRVGTAPMHWGTAETDPHVMT